MHVKAEAMAPPCPFLTALIELLGTFPTSGEGRHHELVRKQLDRLAHDAQHQGAPEATLASIKGARVLLGLSELPPIPSAKWQDAR